MSLLDAFTADRYPLTGYHFRVDILLPGIFGPQDTWWKEVSGIEMELTTEEYKEGGKTATPTMLPTGAKFGDLVLSRGMVKGSFIINWLEIQMLTQMKVPIPLVVSSLDDKGMPIYSWFFVNAYPVKFKTSGFNSMDGQVLMEEITFKYWFYKQVNMSLFSSVAELATSMI